MCVSTATLGVPKKSKTFTKAESRQGKSEETEEEVEGSGFRVQGSTVEG